MNIKINFLSAAESTTNNLFNGNAGDMLLDENGQFLDPSQTVDNVV